MPRQLVLTGVPSNLPKDPQDAVFLAPWCFLNHSEFDLFELPDVKFVPSPHQNADGLKKAAQEVIALLPEVFTALAKYMNSQTGQNHPTVYWKTILFHWTLEFLCGVHDRYLRLNLALRSFPNEVFKVRVFPTENRSRPKNYFQYYTWLTDHGYNHLLLSQLLSVLEGPWEQELISPDTAAFRSHWTYRYLPPPSPPQATSWKKTVKDWIKSIDPDSRYHIGHIGGLDSRNAARIKWGKPSIIHLGPKKPPPEVKELVPQNERLSIQESSPFVKFINEFLTSHLPSCYFFKKPLPENTPKIFVGNDIYSFPESILLAETLAKGGQWVSVQHGGGYGFAKGMPMGHIEYSFADGFVTWGWEHEHEYPANKLIPLPSPQLSELKKNFPAPGDDRDKKIIYVTSAVPFYTYRYDTCAQPELQIRYFKNIKALFNSWPEKTKRNVFIKSYHHDFLLNELKMFEKLLSKERILDNSTPLSARYKEAYLIVNDNLHTSFLESLAINIPTLLYIDETVFPIDERSWPFFKDLKTVGIYHTSLDSLHHYLNREKGEIQEWWKDPEVQDARERFCSYFAKTDDNWFEVWSDFFHQIKKGLK